MLIGFATAVSFYVGGFASAFGTYYLSEILTVKESALEALRWPGAFILAIGRLIGEFFND